MNTEIIRFCDEQMADCIRRSKQLRSDSRMDEARFEQIRSNVYGIFRSVIQTLGNHPEQLAKKLEEIPQVWEASLQQAEAHDDAEKAHIERIKLETARSIKKQWSRLDTERA